jgi:hypothetical protein
MNLRQMCAYAIPHPPPFVLLLWGAGICEGYLRESSRVPYVQGCYISKT